MGYGIFKALEPNELIDLLVVEAGITEISSVEFMKNQDEEGKFVTDISKIDLSLPGKHRIRIEVNGKVYRSRLKIIDTTPPDAEPVNQVIWLNDEIKPKDFVTNIVDATEVTVAYKEKPDFTKIGEQDVFLILKDTSGNRTEVRSKLTIIKDTEPPRIYVDRNQTVYVGETVAYRRNVAVTDNRDEHVELQIDSSNVNLRRPGSYEVIYTATDSSGNSTTEIVTINVKEKPPNSVSEEELYRLVDKVLEEIIEDGMTEIEKAWEIYKWTKNNISYIGFSDKTFWINEAYRGIQRGVGDCFTYYSTARALLTRAGFANTAVERKGGTEYHIWNFVKIDGSWYHFDAGPLPTGISFITFLRTDDELESYSQINNNYYRFDTTKYPPTPTEPILHPRNL